MLNTKEQSNEQIARQIESIIDNYHKSNPVLGKSRNNVLLNTLVVYETAYCMVMDNQGKEISREALSNTQTLREGLNMAVKWIYDCCPHYKIIHNFNIKELKGLNDLFEYAIKYNQLCEIYTLWSRQNTKSRAKLVAYDDKTNTLNFSHSEIDGVNTALLRNQAINNVSTPTFQRPAFDILDHVSDFKKTITLDDKGRIQYDISDGVWEASLNVQKHQIRNFNELPRDWLLSGFTLGEFLDVWAVLCTKTSLHQLAYTSVKGVVKNEEDSIIIKKFDELCSEIVEKTSISYETVSKVISWLIYDPKNRKTHIMWQPIVKLDSENCAIIPSLIFGVNAEHSLISFINKTGYKNIYLNLSTQKEALMQESLSNKLSKYTHLKIAMSRKLPNPLPDMDYILYDSNNKTLFIAEIKWLIAAESVHEILSRDQDLEKGISQAVKIHEYAQNNVEDTLLRAFEESNLPVDHIFSCVISKNSIGSSYLDRKVPIINEESLISLFENYNGNLYNVVKAIKQGDYLPKVNEEFSIEKNDIDYAGYKFSFPQFNPLKKPGIKILYNIKKVKRNDPCPCGSISETTKLPKKYKKCCGVS
ncbi:hypothetical protein CN510_17335 [Priestia megaterium]|uniref:hypothetical protein n=1 Tax=Priestia megaterium TaxID=1404 RepID=UPI000BF9AB1D|nr:hypothetical protein [Priestia megaterium]PES93739.1 hypothetical protein CN510_17335 [Priestia megaterium]